LRELVSKLAIAVTEWIEFQIPCYPLSKHSSKCPTCVSAHH